MMEQIFHMSETFLKKARAKHRVFYATLGFWFFLVSYLVKLFKGESGLSGDIAFFYFVILANFVIGMEFAFKPKWKDTIKLDAESLLLVKEKKEHFTLYSEIDRLIITYRNNQTIRRIKCFYDNKPCIIEGFEDMTTIALILSQNVSKVSKLKVSMLLDNLQIYLLFVTVIFTVFQLGFLVNR